jgi:hypothetical protein
MEQTRAALELYRSDPTSGGTYPTTNFSSTVATLVTKTYLTNPAPIDPKNSGNYVYTYTSSTGTSYCICALLETTNGGNNSSASDCSNVGALGTGQYYCLTNP